MFLRGGCLAAEAGLVTLCFADGILSARSFFFGLGSSLGGDLRLGEGFFLWITSLVWNFVLRRAPPIALASTAYMLCWVPKLFSTS